MAKTSPIDIIIPSYNARYLLERNLPHVVKNTDPLGKLIIIDNGSEDDTISWLNAHFSRTIIVKNSTNLGYTKPVNQGVSASTSDLFVLLNNDVLPEPGYLKKALIHFSNPQVFAVTFNEEGASWPNLFWSSGKMQFTHGEDKTKPVLSAWASGGSAIFRRSIWDKLGGLDEIYAPFYWEDIDIGYRAWKSGYKIVWEPKAGVVHHHESTSKKLNPNYISLIKQRNELLFNWLNVTDSSFRLQHLRFLLTHTLTHPGYVKVVLSALYRFLTAKHLHRREVRSDREVLSIISKPL